jgi:hypothetical protein
MPLTKIVAGASTPMKLLAEWVHRSAKMKKENNLLKCEDDDLHDKTLPLLKALGYDQIQVNGEKWTCFSGQAAKKSPRDMVI